MFREKWREELFAANGSGGKEKAACRVV